MRCESHGLAAAPDGRCAVCRRQASGPTEITASTSSDASLRIVIAVGVALVVILGGGVAYRFGFRHADAAVPEAVSSADDLGPEAVQRPSAAGRAGSAHTAEPDGRDADWQRALASVHIIVYSTSWCPACKETKAFLRQNAIAFEDRDVEASPDYAREMMRLNPHHSIPTVDIEGSVDVGFDPNWIQSTRETLAKRRMPSR